MNIAIIPARGGSKRIPGKNIRDFVGKPIIAYSIETALACGLFEKVIVSTDDPAIKLVAEAAGAEVPFIRPAELADDYTGVMDVVRHAIGWLAEHQIEPEFVCCLCATAPLMQATDIQKGFEILCNSDKHYVFSVTPFTFPIQRALRISEQGTVEAIWPEHRQTRSQDLEDSYHDAAQFYWGRTRAFVDNVVIYSDASLPLVLPPHRVQDVDTELDWQQAELKFVAMQQGTD